MIRLGFDKTRVLVIGDSMLDVYISGNVSRISPEAPVPVVDMTNTFHCLGGAANVAANIASLGGVVFLYCAVGEICRDKVPFSSLLSSFKIQLWQPSGVTKDNLTRKTRIVGNSYQLLRLDEDKIFEWTNEERSVSLLKTRISDGIGAFSSIVLSDYGKGLISEKMSQGVIEAAKERGIPVFVDPKDGDWKKYSGAFCVKPNIFELSKQVGVLVSSISEIKKYGRELMRDLSFTSLLVTMGNRGMALLQNEEPQFMYYPSHLVEVCDVSGAGDTAMAVAASCYSVGLPLTAASHFANKAAAAVVSRKGTQVVTLSDINKEEDE